ncbi:aspartate aminotransferase family protein [Sulfitobacter sp. S0837]|uniref:aspartate aminotransferase family protein n=1 Tax=Sulfitobacter maritimus TaxID=2741719 RepID=UPI00158325B7|nr:aspartate aminotransferase family protein [Sulfitobacter maritimus]NUH65168.1 aspartate aminotransferase family protein [Sulfitobacter maritimus]
MSYVFHRGGKSSPPLAIRATGSWIEDASGQRFLDASGGAAVSCIGHGEPRVIEAIRSQAAQLEYVHSGAFTSAPAEQLAEKICASTPLEMDKVYLVSSGSEAVETAIKMARGYHLACGDVERHHVIARQQSYHGNTLGVLARGGSVKRQVPYRPMLSEALLVQPCFAFHERAERESDEAYAVRAADSLEAAILNLGPETVSAFVAETVVGATAGAVPPSPGYFARVREICDRYGVLLILDEVMCGTWRTGPFLACEAEGIRPDIVTLAKGLGGGYQPIGAAVCTKEIHDAFSSDAHGFVHGHTYMAHPVACAAALAVQNVIAEDRLADNVVAAGLRLRQALDSRLRSAPGVGDIRGRGLLQAVEFLRDRSTKEPFDPALNLAGRIGAACKRNGLLVYPGQGTVDGARGDHVLLAPAYNSTEEEIIQIVECLGRAIHETMRKFM